MSDMFRRIRRVAERADGMVRAAAPVEWLSVVVAGTVVLAALAIPLKLSGPARSALGLASKQIGGRLSVVDYRLAAGAINRVEERVVTSAPPTYVGADGQRITPDRIRAFLSRYRSPLTRYSREIVEAGIRHGVDPRVVVAIAGVESTYGRYAAGHNAWGWNSGKARWPSWSVAIDRYTRALGRAYRSLRTGRFAAASRTYCPPCGKSWGVKALRIFRRI